MATTRAQLDNALNRASNAVGQRLAFTTHNSRGYGLLHIQPPGTHSVTNVIAGNSCEGINRTTAYYICEALENLTYRGLIAPTTKEG